MVLDLVKDPHAVLVNVPFLDDSEGSLGLHCLYDPDMEGRILVFLLRSCYM